jgi:NAD(P)H dehydrogenase (quinone)
MYAITGITGKVGRQMACALLGKDATVRAVVRDARKGEAWAALGCEVAIAEMEDAAALTRAFTGVEGVFILPPPLFDPQPGYPEARAVIANVARALSAARPGKVVCLSTVGADAAQDNLLSQRTLMEQALEGLDLPVTFLRPAWFLDNVEWDIVPARDTGTVSSFLQPTDRAIPMVAAKDVGRVAADLIQEDWTGVRVVNLEGPARVSPNDLATVLSGVLGRPVTASVAPRETWEPLFRSQGMTNPQPRIRMIDGFNEGWIAFPDGSPSIKGWTTASEVVAELAARD